MRIGSWSMDFLQMRGTCFGRMVKPMLATRQDFLTTNGISRSWPTILVLLMFGQLISLRKTTLVIPKREELVQRVINLSI